MGGEKSTWTERLRMEAKSLSVRSAIRPIERSALLSVRFGRYEGFGCWGATEQKTGLSKFQATSSRTSAGFLNGRNSPRVTASGTEKALATEQIDMLEDEGRKASHIFWCSVISFPGKLLERSVDIERIPKNDHINN
jgi:hypothetical protein